MFEEEYRLDFFEKKGYQRKQCSECGSYFWTLDEDLEVCQDAPCVEFGFLGDPPTDREFSVSDIREYFIKFFSERGHTPLGRYPVAARWRDDVFLVHASIYDFQPHVTSGQVDPPANPLVVSQPCIRLPDLDEVGRTGKHLSSFEMMGHHAFNSKKKYVYWKEETVEYCHEMLLDIGVPEEEIVYKEHPWIGGGNAGPSLEVNVLGLEVATLVFMNMEQDPDGEVELDGDRYSPLDLNVVDTGYGVERWGWISNGAPTVYDYMYPEIVKYICEEFEIEHPLEQRWYSKMLQEYTKLAGSDKGDYRDKELIDDLMQRLEGQKTMWSREKVIEHLERLKGVYTLADHSRTLALMLSDGIVPSNVEDGYLVRMMIRRSLRQIDQMKGEISLKKLVGMQMDNFSDIIDLSKKDLVFDMLDNEIEKYEDTLERGKRLVKRELEEIEGETLSLEKLIEFYDTHGIHPTIVKDLAHDYDIDVDIPDNFSTILARRHEGPEGKEEEVMEEEYKLPPTKPLYYDEPNERTFEAVVLESDGNEVILDQTLFYPEGGGQPSDNGILTTDKRTFDVEHVKKVGDVIVHDIDGHIPKGEPVKGRVDWKRRNALTRHHTATHIIISAAREVLGNHIWQRGAQKGVSSARLDISHYKKISRDELKDIEKKANEIVLKGIPVVKEELTRDEAEKRFGFELYQGGVPQSDIIRVVHISGVKDIDAQACGGTHVDNTSDVGAIKILNTQRIQDGVERLTYSAGMATIEEFQRQEDLLLESASAFSVNPDKLPDTAKRFFREWKERGKELEKLKKYKSIAVAEELVPGEKFDDIEIISSSVDMGTKEMLSTAERLTSEKDRVVLLASSGDKAQLVFSRSDNLDINMSDILREAAKNIDGGGGGSPKTAQGGGSKPEGSEEALNKAKELVLNQL